MTSMTKVKISGAGVGKGIVEWIESASPNEPSHRRLQDYGCARLSEDPVEDFQIRIWEYGRG